WASPNNGGSTGINPTSSHVAYLRQHYEGQRLSKDASDLLLSSWRQKTSQSYDSLTKKWIGWCTERQCNPVSGLIEDVVNFLAHLYKEGYQYRSLNAYRSAIASMHTPIEGVSIGQHPLVSRLLKGAFQSRPPLPRYQGTWDVSVVLHHIGEHQLDGSITLKQLSLRIVMLLALTRPSRSADISKLNLRGYRNTPEGAAFTLTALAKQSRPGRSIKDFFFLRFTENERLCPVKSLTLYIERTKELRGNNDQLFISFIKPHHLVT
uniref:Core-binding (CB) domain-containing protein n=1 Tax=Amphimedon queenslandica TaxID=400682 RepID=A0A1X7TH61_AMPQE